MTRSMHLLTAAALVAGAGAPLAAQYPYPQPYPQQYPYQQPYPGYPQNQNVVGQIIDSLIGNRYNYNDRRAIRSCGFAAVQRAEAQYSGLYNQYRDDRYRDDDRYGDDDRDRYDQYGQPYPRDDRYRNPRTGSSRSATSSGARAACACAGRSTPGRTATACAAPAT